MLNERSRSERIVSRCRFTAESSTPVASSSRPPSSESIAASSIRLIPESDCTGPSWRKSASRRRSSCSAMISWSVSRARSASRSFASASSCVFSTARQAKSASSFARASSSRSSGFARTSCSEPISSPRIRSGSTTAPAGPLAPGASSVALAPKSSLASRRVRSSTCSGACGAAIELIDSISDSRKLDCAESSSSTTSCRRRSVTIRCSANPAAPTIAAPRPAKASQLEFNASPSRDTIAAAATAATSRDRSSR